MRLRLDASPFELSLLTASYVLCYVAGCPLVGAVAERIGYDRLTIASSLLFASLCILLAGSDTRRAPYLALAALLVLGCAGQGFIASRGGEGPA